MPPRPPAPSTPEHVFDLARRFMESRILLSAFELDLFTALGRGRKTARELARARRSDPRATDRLLNACCALGLLTKRAGRFANTPLTARHLVRGAPGYLGGLGHIVHMWESWSTLTEAVRRGHSTKGPPMKRGADWAVPFIAAMHQFSRDKAPGIARMVNLRGVRRVLDVGGGSGVYAMAFVKAAAGAKATVFDLPNVVPLTQGYVKRENLSRRVTTVAGDLYRDELPRGHDLAFVSAIIHMLSPRETEALFRKCFRALEPGGRIVVQDFVMDEDRTTPPNGAVFALNMLVNTRAGDTYTAAEIAGWLKRAGFRSIRRAETPYLTTLMTGEKPRRAPR
jgi:ubiquinone/menaquinone biosynthesis C-methylase UbiE